MNNKISIYIPVYNGEKTIKKAIDSILKQTIKVNEIIIVNDFSNDDTLKIVKSYKNIKIINNKKNLGLSASRNIAIKKCKNKIIANIDADIVLEKNWLFKMKKYLKEKDVVMCGGNTKEKYVRNIYNKWRSERYPLNWGKKNKKNPAFLFGCNSIQYKYLWKKIKGYNPIFRSAGDDVDYGKKIAAANFNTFYVNNAYCFHLQNDNLHTLSYRVWRYHSYGYKIKKVTLFRFFKLIIKQFNFLIKRLVDDLLSLNIKYFLIDTIVFFNFIYFEGKNVLKNK